ncbi:hypothetical protein [Oceanibacterium hippocampi]|uniref:Sulfotransferase family protein n=1 Tax=Oceanibacterium hippocampi TaxID=745714 RepID=A0A1Y5SEI2_9PROT|nr:hypothetical protein [Oceanibacterium hippocampi]SLN38515.1 hypothetical protein OCH7691_01588 [Oceanibacterium hippocampi]
MSTDPAFRFLVLSHGRQGTFSLYLALNRAGPIHVPPFEHSDLALANGDAEALFRPRGPFAWQAHPPLALDGRVPGLIHHNCARAEQLPGHTAATLASILRTDAPLILFARDPVENIVSVYNTYLEMFFAGRLLAGAAPSDLYARDEPMTLAEAARAYRYLGRYGEQLAAHAELGGERLIGDFTDLDPERLPRTLTAIAALLGLDGLSPAAADGPGNPGTDLLLQRAFGFRERPLLDGFPLELGFFPRASDPLCRGSLEIPLPGDAFHCLPPELGVFVSARSWYAMPPAYREAIAGARDPDRLVMRSFDRYLAFVEQVRAAAQPLRRSPGDAATREPVRREVVDDAAAFARAWPDACRSWRAV